MYLIIYPITRIIPFPIALYNVVSLDLRSHIPVPHYWLVFIGGCCLILLSVVHTVEIWINPKKCYMLNVDVNDDDHDHDEVPKIISEVILIDHDN